MKIRLIWLAAVLCILAAWGLWQVYTGWGLVTLDYDKAPVSKVLRDISRQSGIEIASNLDPDTTVSISIQRASPIKALDILSVRTDSSWRLGYLGALDRASIDAALNTFRSGGETTDWTAHGRGGFNMVQPESGDPLDLRRVQWKCSGEGELSALLEEAAEETGIFIAAPAAWNPVVYAPKNGTISQVIPRLFRQAGGVSLEIFLLRRQSNEWEREDGNRRRPSWIGTTGSSNEAGRSRGWSNRMGDPSRIAERVEAQIALLPQEEQAQAQKDFQTMRQFWEGMGELPEAERRAKAQEFFNRPEVAERMESRRAARWAKMTPAQRIARSKSYWERKVEKRQDDP